MKVIITGMHRSGTSMVTGLLNLCGLYLGNNLISGLRDNPKGHFEDRKFVQLNDEILKSSGGSWDTPPRKIVPSEDTFSKMSQFARNWPKDRLAGWKDPRACLTLPWWAKTMFPGALKVVLVSRPFDEIAASLAARNGMGETKAKDLCFQYMKRAMDALKGIEWVPTVYGNYFEDWKKELSGVTKFLGLKIPADHGQIKAFIDPGLRHHGGGN